MDHPLMGTRIGNYEITDFLGSGGMGDVYKARHIYLNTSAAIKILTKGDESDANLVTSFLREAQTASKIKHDNVVQVYDIGEASKYWYLIMELVPGTDCYRLIQMYGALSLQDSITIIEGAARGLAAIHEAKLVHRDIKPHNLFITQDMLVKVGDFGLVRYQDTIANMSNKVAGTPAYMAPEQLLDVQKISPTTDVYSLGATFYHLVTGKTLYDQKSFHEILTSIALGAPFLQPNELVPEIPTEVNDIILKMTQREQNNRFQTMAEVLQGLKLLIKKPTPSSILTQSNISHIKQQQDSTRLSIQQSRSVSRDKHRPDQPIQTLGSLPASQSTHLDSMLPVPDTQSVRSMKTLEIPTGGMERANEHLSEIAGDVAPSPSVPCSTLNDMVTVKDPNLVYGERATNAVPARKFALSRPDHSGQPKRPEMPITFLPEDSSISHQEPSTAQISNSTSPPENSGFMPHTSPVPGFGPMPSKPMQEKRKRTESNKHVCPGLDTVPMPLPKPKRKIEATPAIPQDNTPLGIMGYVSGILNVLAFGTIVMVFGNLLARELQSYPVPALILYNLEEGGLILGFCLGILIFSRLVRQAKTEAPNRKEQYLLKSTSIILIACFLGYAIGEYLVNIFIWGDAKKRIGGLIGISFGLYIAYTLIQKFLQKREGA